ncbi:MAG TPA: DUF4105 domain-containing protein [Burkholderiales bacterium]|nr:DUF4105 domain-containing protein [Burkholderiales bacterium]
MHYVANLIAPGVHGLVDSRDFYNAPEGKNDPQAELEGTLRAFFFEAEETDEVQHPQCRFPARYAWLATELGFDERRMPRPQCRRYREWRSALDAKQLTLVFASAYLNNPGSMYGHTLLRVDAADQDERTRLLAYSISFAADTNETNGIIFAVKGLFGGYPGVFAMLPYYVKVREYSDLENRDLWEYELNLSPEELERVLRHAWELLPAYFEYYFFDENCSYHLLALLQVARPDLELTAPFRLWALPVDTVRVLTDQPGLVKRIVYRPARSTIIAERLARMQAEDRRMARDLGRGRLNADDAALRALPPERAARAIEAGYDYLNYRRTTGTSEVKDGGALARDLLVARSQIDAPSQTPRIETPVRPDEGHRTARISAGAGRRDQQDFLELGVRPTYHDIVDDDAGYIGGAQIEFFHLRGRRYAGSSARIESFIPVDIFSLSTRDEFFQPKTWRLAAGWQRSVTRSGAEPLAVAADGALGGAWRVGRKGRFYATAEGAARAHEQFEKGYTIGVGARIGALIDPAPRWRVHAYAQQLGSVAGERVDPGALVLEQRFSLTRDLALRFDLGHQNEAGRSFDSGSLALHIYF